MSEKITAPNWRTGLIDDEPSAVKAPLSPDFEEARRHVEALTGGKDTPLRFRLINPETKAVRKLALGSLENHWPEIETANNDGFNVYFIINEGGDTDADITKVRAVFVDGDDVPMPAEWHVEPDFILARDNTHWHAYWKIYDLAVADFKNTQQRLAALYGTDESVCNPSRVLRLAGTLRHKDGLTSPGYKLVAEDADRATLLSAEEILTGLPEIEAREPTAPSAAAGVSITPEMLRAMLGYIDPDDLAQTEWLGVAKAVRYSQLPLTEALDADAGFDLLDSWCSGALQRARTGLSAFHPSTYRGREELLARTADAPRETGAITRLGTIISHAQAGGYAGPIVAPSPAPREAAQAVLDAAPEAPADDIDLVQAKAASARQRVKIYRMEDMENTPPPEYLIENFLIDKSTSLLYARWGEFKSFTGVDVSMAVATGRNLFNSPSRAVVHSGPAIYLTPERPDDVMVRIRAWLVARNSKLSNDIPIHLIKSVPAARDPADVEYYIEDIRLHLAECGESRAPRIIVIDTMRKAMLGMDENSARDIGIYWSMADRLQRAFDCHVMTIAHTGKDVSKGVSGSDAAGANFDQVIGQRGDRDAQTAHLWTDKIKAGPDIPDVYIKGSLYLVPRASTGETLSTLVFDEVRAPAPSQEAGKTGGVTRGEVGAALKALKAVKGEGNSVTTYVLASQIAGPGADENTIKAKEKCIRRGAKDQFFAYLCHHGKGGAGDPSQWIFPHETEVADHA